MNQKKNKGLKVAIIIVLFVILILITAIISIYFLTDIFRSNKETFFKYTAQLIQQEDGFIADSLVQYLEKKKNTSYENNGTINFDVAIPEIGQDNEALNNFNISFSGKTDNANLKSEKNITLNYSNDVNFPFYYRKVNDVQGIQTNHIGSKYIAVRDGEEIPSLENMNFNINGLEEITALYNEMQISNQDLQNLKVTYFDNIFNQIPDNKFSKISEENTTGYKLELSGDDLKDILVKVLEKLREDEETLDKLNQLLGLEQSASKIRNADIDSLINDITNNVEIGTLEITVYKTNGKLSKINIQHDNLNMLLEKSIQENELRYNVSIEILQNSKQIYNANVVARFTGIETDNVIENYEVLLGTNYTSNLNKENTENDTGNIAEELEKNQEIMSDVRAEYKYILNNTVQFTQNSDIQDFLKENAIILNDEDEEYTANLMGAVEQRLITVNQEQMEQIGISAEQNPLNYILPTIFIENLTGNTTGSNVSEEEVTTFNDKFYLYEGTSQKGVTVRGLMSIIQTNNESATSENRKIKEIHFDGEEYEVIDQNITLIKDSLEPETLYRVEFELDSNTGLIYRAVINKQ